HGFCEPIPMSNCPKLPIPSIGTAFAKSISIVGHRHPQPLANPTVTMLFALPNQRLACPLQNPTPLAPSIFSVPNMLQPPQRTNPSFRKILN
ncbi:MAG: hypothetical protein RR063_04375, partial [Anaerovoracaceae bacterium]